MQAVGLEPTRANTLRPERSTLDHSVTLAFSFKIFLCILIFYQILFLSLQPFFSNKHFNQYVYDIEVLL